MIPVKHLCCQIFGYFCHTPAWSQKASIYCTYKLIFNLNASHTQAIAPLQQSLSIILWEHCEVSCTGQTHLWCQVITVLQVKFLKLRLAKELGPFLWSMYTAVALKNLSWIVITMVWAFPHVDTGKMLELFAKVRCNNCGSQVVVKCWPCISASIVKVR